jgi:putative FmdB family regulatory protein
MPIFEFKCSKCEEFFEVIVMGADDDDTVSCPKCKSKEFQRVVSTINYAMGNSSSGGGATGVQTQERECATGSCKTYTVPGATRD